MHIAGKIAIGLMATGIILNTIADKLSKNADNEIINDMKTELRGTSIDEAGYSRVVNSVDGQPSMIQAIKLQKAIDSVNCIHPSRVEFEAKQLMGKTLTVAKNI